MEVRKWGRWLLALAIQALASGAYQICYRGDSPRMDQICNSVSLNWILSYDSKGSGQPARKGGCGRDLDSPSVEIWDLEPERPCPVSRSVGFGG